MKDYVNTFPLTPEYSVFAVYTQMNSPRRLRSYRGLRCSTGSIVVRGHHRLSGW